MSLSQEKEPDHNLRQPRASSHTRSSTHTGTWSEPCRQSRASFSTICRFSLPTRSGVTHTWSSRRPAIRCTPVAVAVRPPRVELLVRRHEMPHRIDEASVLPCGQSLGLRRRVAHHAKQLLVAPDIMLQRRDVQVADEHAAREPGSRGEPVPRLGDEVELVAVLHILRAIGDVAAGGDIEVVQFDRATLGCRAARRCAGNRPCCTSRARCRAGGSAGATGSRRRCSPSCRGTAHAETRAVPAPRPETARPAPWSPAGRSRRVRAPRSVP